LERFGNMRKKIIGVFVCMLMIISAMTTILYSNNVKVEASGGGGGGNGVGLDYDFMWNVTNHLSDIINTSYLGNVIRKGGCSEQMETMMLHFILMIL
jgi:hypothetical protein